MSNDCKCSEWQNSFESTFVGKEGITKDFDIVEDNKIYDYIFDMGKFFVPKKVRFRDDEDIFIVNIRWEIV